MNVSANIATYPPRLNSLRQMLVTIYDQFDIIRIYFNEFERVPKVHYDPERKIISMTGKNLADNGKFCGLDMANEHEYYFTLDDDLLYPADYVEKTLKAIEMYGCIVTYHGRKLTGLDLDYYKSHEHYHCLKDVHGNFIIDVAGTGVSAWSTKYFKPKGLDLSPDLLMSDLVFSWAAANYGKRIGVIEHKGGWIGYIHHQETIYETEVNNGQMKQIEYANKIYERNYN